MRTSFSTALIIMLGLASYSAPRAEIIQNEAAVEAIKFSITHARVGGFIQAQQCQKCPQLNLQIDANTKAIASGKEVPVSSIPPHPTTAVTVIYDPKTKIAKRVLW